MRNWLLVGVSILDQLKDELHLVLVVLHGDFLVDSMDTEGRSILGGGDKGQMMYVAQELAQNTLPGSPPPHMADLRLSWGPRRSFVSSCVTHPLFLKDPCSCLRTVGKTMNNSRGV